MKKWMTVLSVITAVLGIAVPVSAATSNSVVIAEYRTELSQYFGEKFEPPYGINSNNTEIDRGTAAVNTREVDISLPGKNGLDLNFIRTQSSLNTEAKFHHQSGSVFIAYLTGVYYTCEKDGVTKTYLIGFDREDDIFSHETLYARESFFRDSNHLTARDGTKFYRYGDNKVTDREDDTITTLVIDKTLAPVQLTLREETFHTAKQNIKRTELSKDTLWEIDYKPEFVIELEDGYNERMHGYFKNEKGEVYQLQLIYWRMTSSESGHYSGAYVQKDSIDCDEHEVEMVTELVRNSYNCWGTDYNVPHERGFSYTLCVTDKMGKEYYFKAGSRLTTYSKMECQAVIDRYGNMIDYANGIDSMGRHFEVDKSGITVTAGNLTQKVFYQEERFNDDEKDPFGKMEFDDTYIFRVLKQETAGQEPAACDDVTEYRMKRYQMSEYSNEALWTYNAQIEQITYPTGGIEVFTYAPFKFNNGQASEREFVDRPLVSTYKNYENGVLKSDKSFTYTFQTGDVMIEDFKEQNVSLGRTNTYTFDKYGRIDEVNFGYGSTYTKISYGYKLRDDSKRITSLISYNPIRQTRNYEYDSDGNITMSNDSFVEENSTYADYGLMLQSIYMRDTRYKIIVENTLTEDRNNIAKTDVYEADTTVTGRTLKETTSYTYDTYGNLASVTKNDGTRTVTTGYTYQYNTDGSYSVTQTLNNTTDADGNVTTGIQTATVYDSLGRPVSVTDANGNTTLTEYDLRNRITKVTNPDGTQQQITYDTANNTIIAQDELGAQTKYVYSPLGLLQYVYVKDGENWLLSAERSYDTELRVSEETVYQDYSVTPPKSITAAYSYADNNELLSATAKDETGAVVQRVQYNYGKNIYVGTKQANAVTQTLTGDESITPNKIKTYTDVRGLVCMEEILNPSTNAVLYKNTYAYDLMGNLLETKDGRAWEEDWDYTQKMEYDYAGRMLKQYDALGNFAQNTYNQLGQLGQAPIIHMTSWDAPFKSQRRWTIRRRVSSSSITIKTEISQKRRNCVGKILGASLKIHMTHAIG